jgi:rhodanese-related sulfurtransferase
MKNDLNRPARKAGVGLLLAVAMAGVGLCLAGCKSSSTAPTAQKEAAPQHPALSLAEFEADVAAHKNLVLDARNVDDYKRGHVPGALNLPVWNFADHYEELGPVLVPHQNDLVIVYCSSRWCDAADELQLKLIARGHKHVALFPGGWSAWQEAKLPEERSN